jgi:hypothetical protein
MASSKAVQLSGGSKQGGGRGGRFRFACQIGDCQDGSGGARIGKTQRQLLLQLLLLPGCCGCSV